jgi:hypothetical protein
VFAVGITSCLVLERYNKELTSFINTPEGERNSLDPPLTCQPILPFQGVWYFGQFSLALTSGRPRIQYIHYITRIHQEFKFSKHESNVPQQRSC